MNKTVMVPVVELAKIEEARLNLCGLAESVNLEPMHISYISEPMWKIANRKWPEVRSFKDTLVDKSAVIAAELDKLIPGNPAEFPEGLLRKATLKEVIASLELVTSIYETATGKTIDSFLE